jgi:hypothetical protein
VVLACSQRLGLITAAVWLSLLSLSTHTVRTHDAPAVAAAPAPAPAAAALSEHLTEDAPLGVEILGSKVVLFREGNTIKCLDDTCPHRSARGI